MSFTTNSIFFIQVNIMSRKLWWTNNLLQGMVLQDQHDALSLSVFCLISIPSKYPNNCQAYNQPTYNPWMFVAFNQTYILLDIIHLEPWDLAQFSTTAESIVWSGWMTRYVISSISLTSWCESGPTDGILELISESMGTVCVMSAVLFQVSGYEKPVGITFVHWWLHHPNRSNLLCINKIKKVTEHCHQEDDGAKLEGKVMQYSDSCLLVSNKLQIVGVVFIYPQINFSYRSN